MTQDLEKRGGVRLVDGAPIVWIHQPPVGARRMAKFTVLRRVDAFVDYVAEVEADTPDEAAAKAGENEERYSWQREDVHQFDARLFVTLDVDGNEIESTLRSDF